MNVFRIFQKQLNRSLQTCHGAKFNNGTWYENWRSDPNSLIDCSGYKYTFKQIIDFKPHCCGDVYCSECDNTYSEMISMINDIYFFQKYEDGSNIVSEILLKDVLREIKYEKKSRQMNGLIQIGVQTQDVALYEEASNHFHSAIQS